MLLELDHPPANAMNLAVIAELGETLERVAADPPGAVVLAGRGRMFSAGVDLKAIPEYGPEDQRRMVQGINRMVIDTYALPCPVVAAVGGHAIAGGLVLALRRRHADRVLGGSLRAHRGRASRCPIPQAALMLGAGGADGGRGAPPRPRSRARRRRCLPGARGRRRGRRAGRRARPGHRARAGTCRAPGGRLCAARSTTCARRRSPRCGRRRRATHCSRRGRTRAHPLRSQACSRHATSPSSCSRSMSSS